MLPKRRGRYSLVETLLLKGKSQSTETWIWMQGSEWWHPRSVICVIKIFSECILFWHVIALKQVHTNRWKESITETSLWRTRKATINSATCEKIENLLETMKHYKIVWIRSEEHTSELQSRQYLVCRLLLEKKKQQHKKKKNKKTNTTTTIHFTCSSQWFITHLVNPHKS